ncbi:MAG: hypothetical protein P4L35_11595 [Ignavibacteriaceae bacterium]|nr:hypothetical protein [Ignavibacteriaceae bacterium]
MAKWDLSSRACKTTWSTLMTLDQIDEVFINSGTIKMADFALWNPASSAAIRQVQASTIANQMDNIFRNIRHDTYQNGIDNNKAINDIVAILIVEDKTISDLAEVINSDYIFF